MLIRKLRKLQFKKLLVLVVVWVLGALLAGEIALQALALGVRWSRRMEQRRALASEGKVVVACIGESTTYRAYPQQLQDVLDRRLGKGVVKVVDLGVPSITTGRIRQKLEADLKRFDPDIVITMIGVNDADGFDVNRRAGWFSRVLRCSRLFCWGRNVFSKRFQIVRPATPDEKKPDGKTPDFQRLVNSQNEMLESLGPNRFVVEKSTPLPAPETVCSLPDGFDENSPPEKLEVLVSQNPDCLPAYVLLAQIYNRSAQQLKAAGLFDAAFGKFPHLMSLEQNCRPFIQACVELKGHEYKRKGMDIVRRCLKHDADDLELYYALGCFVRELDDTVLWERFCNEMVRKFPHDMRSYYEVAFNFLRAGQFGKALGLFKLIWESTGSLQLRQALFSRLWECLFRAGRTDEFVEYMSKWQSGFDRREQLRFLRMLKTGLLEQGHIEQVDRLDDRLLEYELEAINPDTVENYKAMCRTVLGQGRVFVAMQYPLRSVGILKNLLAGFGSRIWFFENRVVFQKAVAAHGLLSCFIDMFGDDFGHTTPQGCELLASSVADQLVEGPLSFLVKKGQ